MLLSADIYVLHLDIGCPQDASLASVNAPSVIVCARTCSQIPACEAFTHQSRMSVGCMSGAMTSPTQSPGGESM